MDKLLLSILTGLGAMFGWGSADFFASKAIKKFGTFKTFFWMMVIGGVEVTLAMLLFTSDFHLSLFLLVLILISAFAWVGGYLLLYRAFQIGTIPIVSTVVTSQSIIAVIIGVTFFQEELSLIEVISIAIVILGSLFVSLDFDIFKGRKVTFLKGFKEALLAAILFGAIFVPLNKYLTERTDWLFVNFLTRISSLVILLIISFLRKISLKTGKVSTGVNLSLWLVGILDVSALLSMSFGLSKGLAVIVAPISQCLSIVTILMAVIFLKEKLKLNQIIGIVLTVIGIVTISIFAK